MYCVPLEFIVGVFKTMESKMNQETGGELMRRMFQYCKDIDLPNPVDMVTVFVFCTSYILTHNIHVMCSCEFTMVSPIRI